MVLTLTTSTLKASATARAISVLVARGSTLKRYFPFAIAA
jgi:hypothetical protein